MEQLVSIETAQLARQLGFEEPCLFFCKEDGKVKSIQEVELDDYSVRLGFNFNHRYSNEVDDKYPLSLPTQSLLQKWLREHLGINVYCTPVSSIPGYDINDKRWFHNIGSHDCVDESYGESLEKGLFEVLKGISNE